MNGRSLIRGARTLGLGTFLCGCALTSKAEVITPRYFSPERDHPAAAEPAAQPFELR